MPDSDRQESTYFVEKLEIQRRPNLIRTTFFLKVLFNLLHMRQYGDLCRKLNCFLWTLIFERTKRVKEAKNFSLLPETEFFNRIDPNETFMSCACKQSMK